MTPTFTISFLNKKFDNDSSFIQYIVNQVSSQDFMIFYHNTFFEKYYSYHLRVMSYDKELYKNTKEKKFDFTKFDNEEYRSICYLNFFNLLNSELDKSIRMSKSTNNLSNEFLENLYKKKEFVDGVYSKILIDIGEEEELNSKIDENVKSYFELLDSTILDSFEKKDFKNSFFYNEFAEKLFDYLVKSFKKENLGLFDNTSFVYRSMVDDNLIRKVKQDDFIQFVYTKYGFEMSKIKTESSIGNPIQKSKHYSQVKDLIKSRYSDLNK